MAEEPSSEAQGSLEKVEVEAEKPLPLLPPSETPPPKSESASLPAVTCSPPPSSDPAPSSSSSPVKAVEVEDSAPKIVAASPATAEESTESPNDGGDDGGGKRRSPSPVPAGAATPPSGNPSASGPVVAVPVDAMRLVAVPYFIAPAALLENSGFASHFAITHQAVLATVTAQAQMQLRAGNVPPPAISPISVAPPKQEKPSAPSEENLLSPDGDQEQHPSGSKTESPHPGPMKTPGDGYNWRKYGQKQVKGTENARSYYRCTHASCPAKKKVEHRQDGHVLEVIYRGGHNHQPPQKSRFSKDKRPLPLLTSGDAEFSTPGSAKAARAEPSPLKSEPPSLQGNGIDKRLHCSSDCEADGDAKARRNQEEEPELKRRAVERAKASPTNPLAIVIKTAREPKIIRHLISDPGSMSDGYRWRKYGQKFVKGNPNPRSYYRCTHVGCPARKHVEKDSTDDGAVIINYEGNHNHGLPPPKTPASAASAAACPPPATDLLVAAAAAIEAGGHATPRQASPPAGAEQLPSEPATDGSLESAQTLLSIGGARPLFDDHRPAVSVQNS